jgi:hypothetical protein
MGHNIDLEWLMGLPKFIRCIHCKELTPTNFEEYDIDCGEPQAMKGIMTLDVDCSHCNEENEVWVEIKSGVRGG